MGIQYIFLKTVGLIPGPIALGHLLDQSCRLWQDICGEKGRCFVYDVDLVTRNVCIFGAIITGKENEVRHCSHIEYSFTHRIVSAI